MNKVPYIPIQLVYRHHKPEWFHAMIDTGSDVTMVSANTFPDRYWQTLRKPLQVVVASGQITTLHKAVFGQFLSLKDSLTQTYKVIPLPTVVIQAPPNATYNVLLGVDFLSRFSEFSSNHSALRLLTPCGHWLQVDFVSPPVMPNLRIHLLLYGSNQSVTVQPMSMNSKFNFKNLLTNS